MIISRTPFRISFFGGGTDYPAWYRGHGGTVLATTINNSVNQVLSRTVVVSLTVILVLIPLTMFGGEVLHDFSLALLMGVIVGTYSSVFVASPLLILWKGTPGKLLRRR